MKNKLIIVSIFIIFAIVFAIYFWSRQASFVKTINYQLNNKTYKLLTAEKTAEWSRGLMFYKKLDGADGMIFVFPDKQIRNFWNKNTYMDLDIYWLDDNKIVGKDFLPSIEKSKEIIVVNSDKEVNRVIEIIR